MDARGFVTPVAPLTETPSHDLSTPRGRLLYLRDVVVERIPVGELDMNRTDCGTYACMVGWAWRDETFKAAAVAHGVGDIYDLFGWDDGGLLGFWGISQKQADHMFMPASYSGYHAWMAAGGGNLVRGIPLAPLHAELRAHIDDIIQERVR